MSPCEIRQFPTGAKLEPVQSSSNDAALKLESTSQALAVAMENYAASKPPLRNLNISRDLGQLLKKEAVKKQIHALLSNP